MGTYTLGVLVQANHATREELRICGIPFGAEIKGCEADIKHTGPREGGGFHSSSGDIFIAFSTANENAFTYTDTEVKMLGDRQIDPFFVAAAQAVEEAIVNALVSATDMVGRNLNFVPALPHDQVKEILKKYRTYQETAYPGYKGI